MNTAIQSLCDRLVSCRDIIKKTLKWESPEFYPVCANLFCISGRDPDENALIACRSLIKANTGVFSSFRGNVRLPLTCLLSMEDLPEERLQRVIEGYGLLKTRFFASDHLALAAWFLSEADAGMAESIVSRARSLYERMKKEHPFLTGSEDSIYSVLLAQSEKDDNALIRDMEESYTLLKTRFRDSDSVQTVSHCLALDPRTPKEKAARVADLYDELVSRGIKYSRYRELAVLSSLALADGDISSLADEVYEADDALYPRAGWHGVLGYSRRTRAMHAVMLASDLHAISERAGQNALSGVLSSVLAQQMMICAAVAASASAASAASSSH